jgi:hypothetical protein
VRTTKPVSPSSIDYAGYAECMDEIKARISTIDFLLSVPRVPTEIANLESLALNFRKVFELIVMACQAAHTHLIGRKVKEWRIKNLEQLIGRYNPDFYMAPVYATETNIEDRHDVNILTLDELKLAYNRCGDWLHAKGPYRDKANPTEDLSAFRVWRAKVVGLLDGHRVRIDDQTFIYCSMNAGGTGKTHVSIFARADAIPTNSISRS